MPDGHAAAGLASPVFFRTDPDVFSERWALNATWVALAFDFGLKRIGMAGCDSITCHPRPIEAVRRVNDAADWAAIERRVREWLPTQLVSGIPTNADGSPGALTGPAKAFAHELEQRFKIAVAQVDERWSSLEAAERLRSARRSGLRTRRVQKEDIDSTAACVILERWLNTRQQ